MHNEAQHHQMVLLATHPSGADEWLCPTCGRKVLMQWPPDYKKIVLVAGDESAIHTGGKSGLSLTLPENREDCSSEEFIEPESLETLTVQDEVGLDVFQEWFERANFESLWGEQDQ